jgi:hypothetical protein
MSLQLNLGGRVFEANLALVIIWSPVGSESGKLISEEISNRGDYYAGYKLFRSTAEL